ncbi:MAG: flagellar protein FlgN [Smithellaceae bacterium]
MLDQGTFVTTCREEISCEGLFTSLIDVFRKELGIYQELKGFMVNEQQMLLKSSSLDRLNENNAVKENIILKARLLEEVRTSLLKRIAREFNENDDSVALTGLLKYADNDQRRTLANLGDQLIAAARDITAANEANAGLLEMSMTNVRGAIDFLSSLVSRSGVYSGSGKMNLVSGNGKFVRTEG